MNRSVIVAMHPHHKCHPGACPRDPSGRSFEHQPCGTMGPGNECRDDTVWVAAPAITLIRADEVIE
jgi:hypothetical protein